jgi:hypothetical protein
LSFIFRFGRLYEDFPLKEGTVRVPLPFSRNRPENHSHNLGKALGEGLGLLCSPFTLPIPFTTILSPPYPFHLSIPFNSLSLSPLYPFHPSLFLSLSYLSLPIYISPSAFLSLSLLLSLFSLSFSLASSYYTSSMINSLLLRLYYLYKCIARRLVSHSYLSDLHTHSTTHSYT